MVDLRINLLEKQQASPVITLWWRRLYLILAIVFAILLFDGIAVLFVRTVLLSRSKDLQDRHTQITSTIKEKKEIEGLYLTFVSRLNLIDSTQKQSAQLELLPETIDGLLGESVKMESFSIDRNREIELPLQTSDPDIMELILDRLSSFKTEEFSFSNLVVASTEVDKEGNYSIILKFSLDR